MERMWDANKIAHYRRVEREEKRVKEVLGIFEELEEISSQAIEFPVFYSSDKTSPW
jgi:hypothetical protein